MRAVAQNTKQAKYTRRCKMVLFSLMPLTHSRKNTHNNTTHMTQITPFDPLLTLLIKRVHQLDLLSNSHLQRETKKNKETLTQTVFEIESIWYQRFQKIVTSIKFGLYSSFILKRKPETGRRKQNIPSAVLGFFSVGSLCSRFLSLSLCSLVRRSVVLLPGFHFAAVLYFFSSLRTHSLSSMLSSSFSLAPVSHIQSAASS